MLGGLARAVGRNAATARELRPEHRRDGAALGVLALGAGPRDRGLVPRRRAGRARASTPLLRALVGNGALRRCPSLLVGVGAHMLRQAPEPEQPRPGAGRLGRADHLPCSACSTSGPARPTPLTVARTPAG